MSPTEGHGKKEGRGGESVEVKGKRMEGEGWNKDEGMYGSVQGRRKQM